MAIKNKELPVLKIGKHQPKYPIIQGGMGIMVSGPEARGGGRGRRRNRHDSLRRPRRLLRRLRPLARPEENQRKQSDDPRKIHKRGEGSLERRRHRRQLHVRAQRLRRPRAHLVRGRCGRHHLRRGAAAQAAAAHRGPPGYGARPDSQQRQGRGAHHQPLAQALQPHPPTPSSSKRRTPRADTSARAMKKRRSTRNSRSRKSSPRS